MIMINFAKMLGKKLKRWNFFVRRKSHITLFVIGGASVLLLFFNEDTSMKLNMQYEGEIKQLKKEIKQCNDSAEWYRQRREALYIGTEELEHVVREQYHMQRPSEDVYLLNQRDVR